jgi:hypothetical protein
MTLHAVDFMEIHELDFMDVSSSDSIFDVTTLSSHLLSYYLYITSYYLCLIDVTHILLSYYVITILLST